MTAQLMVYVDMGLFMPVSVRFWELHLLSVVWFMFDFGQTYPYGIDSTVLALCWWC